MTTESFRSTRPCVGNPPAFPPSVPTGHDFNNVLGAIMAYTELVRMDTDGWTDVQSHLQQVLKACYRAKDLVRQILTFNRQQRTPRSPVKLPPIIDEVFKLLRSTMPKSIKMEAEVSVDPGLVLADSSQIHQVLVNLCANAAHAMRGRSGRLQVGLDRFEVDEEFARTQPGLRSGPHTRLSITDTGHGTDDDTLKRVFEPFFTTEEIGDGTGLGLAVVHGIVGDHAGAIHVVSRPGHGSMFHIYLPIHQTQSDGLDVPPAVFPRGRRQHVLFVDDEPALGLAVKGLRRRMNYEVTTCAFPAEALNTFRKRAGDFDVVITDLQMPGTTGLELAARLIEIRPRLPVLLMTGFCESWTLDDMRRLGIRDLVMKPLGPADLGATLERVSNHPEEEHRDSVRRF